jgi:hypothetical protein
VVLPDLPHLLVLAALLLNLLNLLDLPAPPAPAFPADLPARSHPSHLSLPPVLMVPAPLQGLPVRSHPSLLPVPLVLLVPVGLPDPPVRAVQEGRVRRCNRHCVGFRWNRADGRYPLLPGQRRPLEKTARRAWRQLR